MRLHNGVNAHVEAVQSEVKRMSDAAMLSNSANASFFLRRLEYARRLRNQAKFNGGMK
jgi:hypothetical protein